MATLSEQAIRLWRSLDADRWQTPQELAAAAAVAPRTARAHCMAFVIDGVAEVQKLNTGYRYRLHPQSTNSTRSQELEAAWQTLL